MDVFRCRADEVEYAAVGAHERRESGLAKLSDEVTRVVQKRLPPAGSQRHAVAIRARVANHVDWIEHTRSRGQIALQPLDRLGSELR